MYSYSQRGEAELRNTSDTKKMRFKTRNGRIDKRQKVEKITSKYNLKKVEKTAPRDIVAIF